MEIDADTISRKSINFYQIRASAFDEVFKLFMKIRIILELHLVLMSSDAD